MRSKSHTITVSFKLTPEDFAALTSYAQLGDEVGNEVASHSEIVRDALKKMVPKFQGSSNPIGFPKGAKRKRKPRSVERASTLAKEIDGASKRSEGYF